MRTYNFLVLGVAFSAMAVSGQTIQLGCNARRPLMALKNSTAFREAIGSANPANFLSSVYDVNGQRLTPESFRSLQCPLFVNSDAAPSASASNAILRAEAKGGTTAVKEQTSAVTAGQPITILSAAGVVAEIPLAEMHTTATQELPQAAPPVVAARVRIKQAERAVSSLKPEDPKVQPETFQPVPELPAQALAVTGAAQAQAIETRQNVSLARQSEDRTLLTFGEASGLIRLSRNGDGVASLEINPVLALLFFTAVFGAVMVLGLMIFRPGPREFRVRVKSTVLRAAMSGLDARVPEPVRVTARRLDLRVPEPVRVAPRRPAALARSARGSDVPAWSLSSSASWR